MKLTKRIGLDSGSERQKVVFYKMAVRRLYPVNLPVNSFP